MDMAVSKVEKVQPRAKRKAAGARRVKRKKTGGRKKGTPNKVSAALRAAVLEAFKKSGGARGMAKWAKGHSGDFYKIVARLIGPEEI